MVTNFSKDTGDYKSLSKTDLKVIALGVQLAKQKGEFDKIKKEPRTLAEFKPKRFAEQYNNIKEADEDSEEEDE